MLLQCGKMQEVEVLMKNRILKQMTVLLLYKNVLFVHSSASILCMALLRSPCTTKMQHRKMDYHVLCQMLNIPYSLSRKMELAQTPGQKHIDACSFVDT